MLKILDISKLCHVSDIAPKILKEHSTSSLTFYVQTNNFYFVNGFWKVKPKYQIKKSTLFSPFLPNFVTVSINSSTFLSVLELPDATPVLKTFAKKQLSACQCPT